VPIIRPFRALRYSPEAVADIATVVAPPYDVIDSAMHRRLLARDPRNVVRLDLPEPEPGDPEDEQYRRAARLLRAWRGDGTLRRDAHPALYPYEQTYRVPGTGRDVTRRGIFARVGLEPLAPSSGIRPHERTLAAPREDRYRLLRATDVNTSPVVGLYEDPSGLAAERLREVSDTGPLARLVDDDGVEHRLWSWPADGPDDPLRPLLDRMAGSPITLADGHHRYETALRYADERRAGPQVDQDPGWGAILMLLLEPEAGPLTVLATHRVLVGLPDAAVRDLIRRLPELFRVREGVPRAELLAVFEGEGDGRRSEGVLGLWTRAGGFLLEASRPAFEPLLPEGGDALRHLDVTLASVAIEQLTGLDPAAVGGGGLAYTRSAAEAVAWVDGGATDAGDAAAAALLLQPTPPAAIVAVAAAGDVMPQKSTYIYPKALTGLVINPLE
jgi:uncharacterized protein (DUF1015 family)